MKNRYTLTALRATLLSAAALTLLAAAPAVAALPKMAWYVPAPHPYFEAVKSGVEAFEKEYNIPVRKQFGPDWNMDSQNTGMLALAAEGYRYIATYPADASAANGLYDEIVKKKGVVVNFGGSTFEPTPAVAAVMTDVKGAASAAARFVFDKVKGKGVVVNVLEVLEDPNTKLRKEGIDDMAAKYPGLKVVEVAGIKSEQEAVEKIESAIAAAGGYVDGIITTGFVPTMALSKVLAEYEGKTRKHIVACGMDDDPQILDAVAKGYLDATIAQNPHGHGYLSMTMLKLIAEGYKVKAGVYKIDAGAVLVSKANVATYKNEIAAVTRRIKADLTAKYMSR